MSQEIKVGDLVQVMRTCCGVFSGYVFTVTEIFRPDGVRRCKKCGFTSEAQWLFARTGRRRNPKKVPLHWLKRIPPLEELDDVKHEEELHA